MADSEPHRPGATKAMNDHPEHQWQKANLIDISSVNLAVQQGECKLQNEGQHLFRLANSEHKISIGTRVVLHLDNQLRIRGQILNQQGDLLTIQEHRSSKPDQRRFPRTSGEIFFKYKELDDIEWTIAPKEVELSIAGLLFTDHSPRAEQALLECEIGLNAESQHWNCQARVIRCLPIDNDHHANDIPHLTAIEFIDMPQEAIDAFIAYMLQIQCAAEKD